MGVLKNLFKEEPKPAPANGINAVLLGPPGSGKGTQVNIIYTVDGTFKSKWNMQVSSTGKWF